MRTLLLKYLLFSILLGTLPDGLVGGFFDVGNLVEHFQQHRAEGNGYGFAQFLAEHYSENQHREADAQHENLPFHHHHDDHCCQILGQMPGLLPPVFAAVYLMKTPETDPRQLVPAGQRFSSTCLSGKIWQPPKG